MQTTTPGGEGGQKVTPLTPKRPLMKVSAASFVVKPFGLSEVDLVVIGPGPSYHSLARLTVDEGQARVLVGALGAALEQLKVEEQRHQVWEERERAAKART